MRSSFLRRVAIAVVAIGLSVAAMWLFPIDGMVPSPYNRPNGCVFHTRCAYKVPGLCDTVVPGAYPVGDGQMARCLMYDEKYAERFQEKPLAVRG